MLSQLKPLYLTLNICNMRPLSFVMSLLEMSYISGNQCMSMYRF